MVAIRIFSIIAAVVAAVIATPTAGHSAPMTVEQASQQCGNGNVVSCCNTADKDLLGLNCAQIPVALGKCSSILFVNSLLISKQLLSQFLRLALRATSLPAARPIRM